MIANKTPEDLLITQRTIITYYSLTSFSADLNALLDKYSRNYMIYMAMSSAFSNEVDIYKRGIANVSQKYRTPFIILET